MSKLATLIALLILTTGISVRAQDQQASGDKATPRENETATGPAGLAMGDEREFVWLIGLRITASGGATGITASAPIPINWPEQTVEIIGEEKSESVGRISIKRLTNDARQMVFRIRKLRPGEVAKAVLKIKIRKMHITGTEHSDQLQFATEKEIPNDIRKFLRPSPFIESSHKKIKEIADSIELSEEKSDYEKAEEIYSWVRQNIEYKFDRTIRTCLEAIAAGHGDCEELSSLFIAICRARGIPARAVWIPSHTYPEFYMVDPQGKGHWIPCQIAGDYQFGAMTEDRPILQKGDKFKLPGEPDPVRYIKPTLLAKDAQGGLKLEFISYDETDPKAKQEPKSTESTKSIFDR